MRGDNMSSKFKLDLNSGDYKSDLVGEFVQSGRMPLSEEHINAMIEQTYQRVRKVKPDTTLEEASREVRRTLADEDNRPLFVNETYQVSVGQAQQHTFRDDLFFPPMIHLSVKRVDREPIDENHWRILQEIKNVIIGLEHEAVELYPADQRVVDMPNQYHLWVFAYSAEHCCFPFGFFGGMKMVGNDKEAEDSGGKQRG
jgi:hypothetical protein